MKKSKGTCHCSLLFIFIFYLFITVLSPTDPRDETSETSDLSLSKSTSGGGRKRKQCAPRKLAAASEVPSPVLDERPNNDLIHESVVRVVEDFDDSGVVNNEHFEEDETASRVVILNPDDDVIHNDAGVAVDY